MLDFFSKKLYDIDRDGIGLFFDCARNVPTKEEKPK